MIVGKTAVRTSLLSILVLLLALALACARAPAPGAQAPQQPAPAAQPQPAAAAAAPQAPAPLAPAAALPRIAPAPVTPALEGPRYGGILRVTHRNDPPAAFDGMRTTNYDLLNLTPSMTGDGNFVTSCRGDELRVCPALAQSWEVNDDFTEWTFRIRDGLVWHDGTPLVADDLTFWMNLYKFGVTVGDKTRLPGVHQASFGDVQKVETLDGNRVRVTLNAGAPTYLDGIGLYRLFDHHPRHLMEPQIQSGNVDIAPLEVGLVGMGPFKFDRYERGVSIHVRRFDKYWEKDEQGRQLPYLDGIDYFIIRDAAAAYAAFRSKRLDVGGDARGLTVTPEQVPGLERSLGDSFFLAEFLQSGGGGLGFNTLIPPFDDVRVRKAVSLWIDRESAIASLGQGRGELKLLMNDVRWSIPDFKTWPGYNAATKEADRAEARRLLAEAGYSDGLEFTLMVRSRSAAQCEWWTGALAGSGFKVKLELLDFAAFDDRRNLDETWQAACPMSTNAVFPEQQFINLGPKDKTPYGAMIHYDPKVLEIFNQMDLKRTLEGRREVLQELERYMLDEKVYLISTYVGKGFTSWRDYVKGGYTRYNLSPPTYRSFVTVWLDK